MQKGRSSLPEPESRAQVVRPSWLHTPDLRGKGDADHPPR